MIVMGRRGGWFPPPDDGNQKRKGETMFLTVTKGGRIIDHVEIITHADLPSLDELLADNINNWLGAEGMSGYSRCSLCGRWMPGSHLEDGVCDSCCD